MRAFPAVMILLLLGRAASGQERYRFALDGRAVRPKIYSLVGAPENPAPGDVVCLGDLFFVLGPEREWNLEWKEGGLYRIDGGKRRLVVALVGRASERDAGPSPLGRSHDELLGLRGLYLDAWNQDAAELVAGIDPEHTCIVLSSFLFAEHTSAGPGPWARGGFPPLPAGLRYLAVRRCRDYGSLVRFRDLRFLDFDPNPADREQARFDAALLQGAKDLRVFVLRGGSLLQAETLALIPGLRQLDLSGNREMRDIGFVGTLKTLEFLDVSGVLIRSLEPIGGLPALRTVEASPSSVIVLPREPLPALRMLDLTIAPVGEAELERFKRLNPACEVIHGLVQRFQRSVAGCDRIRVVNAGPRSPREAAGFVIDDPGAILALIRRTVPRDGDHGGIVGTSGYAILEFYSHGRLLATMELLPGADPLRWREGWRYDVRLTEESREFYIELLAASGMDRPKREREWARLGEAAARLRQEHYARLLPPRLRSFLESASRAKAGPLSALVPDPVDRASLILRLYGCGVITWAADHGYDSLIRARLLPQCSGEDIVSAWRKAPDDPDLRNGLARWLFEDGGWEGPSAPAQETFLELLPVLGAHALADPRRYNRQRTMLTLSRIQHREAIALLLRVIQCRIPLRQATGAQRADPGGSPRQAYFDGAMHPAWSDRSFASLMLVRRVLPEGLRPLLCRPGLAPFWHESRPGRSE